VSIHRNNPKNHIVLNSFLTAGVSAKKTGKSNCQRNAHVMDWSTAITECFKFLIGKGAGSLVFPHRSLGCHCVSTLTVQKKRDIFQLQKWPSECPLSIAI
jgi:hypothetical protein